MLYRGFFTFKLYEHQIIEVWRKNNIISDDTKACRIKPKTSKRDVGNEIFKYCPNLQEYMKDFEFNEKSDI